MDAPKLAHLVGIALLLVLMVELFRAHFRRAASMLDRWARENGYEMLSKKHCLFLKGPFSAAMDGQEVFRVVVQDTVGRVRSGYARCGGALLGLIAADLEVRWDDGRS